MMLISWNYRCLRLSRKRVIILRKSILAHHPPNCFEQLKGRNLKITEIPNFDLNMHQAMGTGYWALQHKK